MAGLPSPVTMTRKSLRSPRSLGMIRVVVFQFLVYLAWHYLGFVPEIIAVHKLCILNIPCNVLV